MFVDGNVVYGSAFDSGRVVTSSGIEALNGVSCGTAVRAPWTATVRPVLAVGSGETLTFPKAPAVEAATVERMAWKMAEFLGPPRGIVPGGPGERDPARDQGVLVRSVRKTRTNGPPVLVAVGYRDADLAVLITDREGERVLASVRVEWPEESGEPQVLPVADFDGDGAPELVVYGEGSKPIRRVFRVAFEGAPRIEAFAPSPMPACAGG